MSPQCWASLRLLPLHSLDAAVSRGAQRPPYKDCGGLTVSRELTSLGLDKKQLELEEMEVKGRKESREGRDVEEEVRMGRRTKQRWRRRKWGDKKRDAEEEEEEGGDGEEAAVVVMLQEQLCSRKFRNQARLCLSIHLLTEE